MLALHERKQKAFNIEIMNLKPERLRALRPTTSVENFEGSTNNFHPDGLFSIDTFGRIGAEERSRRFSFVDIKVDIIHPFIFELLSKVKGLYPSILLGRAFAKWDESIKDFVQSDELNGETGYDFFMRYFQEIQFEIKGASVRDHRLQVIEKYRKVGVYNKLLILPAGLRDADVDEFGQVTDNEINNYYRTILSIANTIPSNASGPIYNKTRANLQIAFNNLFTLYFDITGGRDKNIQKRLLYRRIHNGTRNVIVAMNSSVRILGEPNNINSNHTHVGLFQAAKGNLPVVCYQLRTTILSHCFETVSHGKAKLINPKTLSSEIIDISSKEFAAWATTEGMERFIDKFMIRENRSKPVTIEGYYAALVYLDDNVFKVFYDIKELPRDLNKDKVKPITWAELLYISMGKRWKESRVFITRYPVTGDGSSYPSIPYVKTTTLTDKRYPLDNNWSPVIDPEECLVEYPRLRDNNSPAWVDTCAPHTSRHEGLGADHDGDMVSGNFAYDNKSIRNINKVMSSRDFYVSSDDKLRNSPIDYVAALTIQNMN
jgi:hypothetical protein